MFATNLWKQLKKRLRTKRRWLSLGVFVLIASAVVWLADHGNSSSSGPVPAQRAFAPIVQEEDAKMQAETLEAIKRAGKQRQTVLLKSYICGEERQKFGLLQPDGVLKLHTEHPDWKLRIEQDGSVTFTQNIDDLSPACKDTAFFGIDENGNLTLYGGEPNKDHVIRTFFQLNIRHLESSLPHDTVNQLYSGIRVSDLAEYNSVLSTFSDYAVEETQKAMKTQTTVR